MKKKLLMGICTLFSILYSNAIYSQNPDCSNTFQTDKPLVFINNNYYKAFYHEVPSAEGNGQTDIKVTWQKITIDKKVYADFDVYNKTTQFNGADFSDMIYDPIVNNRKITFRYAWLERNYYTDSWFWYCNDSSEYHTLLMKNNTLVSIGSIHKDSGEFSDNIMIFGNIGWFIAIIIIFFVVNIKLHDWTKSIMKYIYRKRSRMMPNMAKKIINFVEMNDFLSTCLLLISIFYSVYLFTNALPLMTIIIILSGIAVSIMISNAIRNSRLAKSDIQVS